MLKVDDVIQILLERRDDLKEQRDAVLEASVKNPELFGNLLKDTSARLHEVQYILNKINESID